MEGDSSVGNAIHGAGAELVRLGLPSGCLWDGAAKEQSLGLTWHQSPSECVTPNESKHFSVEK